MEMLNQEIGNRIRLLRRENYITQENLAEKLDVTVKHISAVERGLSSLSIEKLVSTCEVFDCSLDYLIRGVNHKDLLVELPTTISNILQSDDQSEKELLNRYLKMYGLLRTGKDNNTDTMSRNPYHNV